MIMIYQSKWMLEEGCDPKESPCWSRLLAGLVASRGPTLEHSAPEGLHPVEGSWRNVSHGKGSRWRSWYEENAGLSPVGGEEWSRRGLSGVLSLSRVEEKTCGELTADPLLHTPVPVRRGKLVKKWSRLHCMALSHSVLRFQSWSPRWQAHATGTTLSVLCSASSNRTRNKEQA